VGPGKPQLRKYYNHPAMQTRDSYDLKILFGWLIGENTREEVLREHPDLKGVV
jgi:hypothetical protein